MSDIKPLHRTIRPGQGNPWLVAHRASLYWIKVTFLPKIFGILTTRGENVNFG